MLHNTPGTIGNSRVTVDDLLGFIVIEMCCGFPDSEPTYIIASFVRIPQLRSQVRDAGHILI